MASASHGIPRVSGATAKDKSEQAKQKEQRQIEQYKALEKEVIDLIVAHDYSNTTLQATNRLLNQNPEYYTIWNYRRLVLQHVFSLELSSANTATIEDADARAAQAAGVTPAQQEIHLLISEDLNFLIPLLKQFPKCYWIWNHRSWLLATATKHLPAPVAVELWRAELGLVSKMLSLDSRNFHGWGYRREVVQSIESLSGTSMVEPEFEYTSRMIRTNLSNFSAWHNRSQLLSRILGERQASAQARKEMLDSEFELITQALYTDPYDQSLWFYYEALMSNFESANPQGIRILDPCSDQDRVEYLDRELENLKEMLDGAEDCKYIYQALLQYSQLYLSIDGTGTARVDRDAILGWLSELKKLDPLRHGRWKDVESKMKL